MKKKIDESFSRRIFIRKAGLGALAISLLQSGCTNNKKNSTVIQGFEDTQNDLYESKKWSPVSGRKIRVGIVGYGFCKFGAAFGFQNHPNVDVVAVSDLIPERCASLAKDCRCKKTYPSLDELVKDESIEAVFLATDAPNHAQHAIKTLEHGKHVACCVPAVFGSLEDAEKLLEAVRKSGLKYMMFETSCFHEDLFSMQQIYQTGGFGRLLYSEGEYYHYMPEPLDSFMGWRIGLPPQFYPTHSNAYYIGITGGSFIEVSCMGIPSNIDHLMLKNNSYKNPFGSEIALFRTSDGGMSRMAVSWDTPGDGGERGRIRGERGSYYGKYEGLEKSLPDVSRPPLPPGVNAGGHGGSHGRLTDEFVSSILQDRNPIVGIETALNMTVPGIIAHESALKDGELLKIPQYKL